MTNGSITRLPCGVCNDDSKRCKIISSVFTRKVLKVGYHLIGSIPAEACNVSIAQMTVNKNSLALRVESSRSKNAYILNGNWAIARSDTYTINGNTFKYHNPLTSNKESPVAEYIQFGSKLTMPIAVYIIYQNENDGVITSYLLPPLQSKAKSPTMNTAKDFKDLSNNTIKMNNNTKSKESGTATGDETVQRGAGNLYGNALQFLHQRLEARHQEDDADINSRLAAFDLKSGPSWLGDLQNVLSLWKKQLEDMDDAIAALEVSFNTKLSSMQQTFNTKFSTMQQTFNTKLSNAQTLFQTTITNKVSAAETKLSQEITSLKQGMLPRGPCSFNNEVNRLLL